MLNVSFSHFNYAICIMSFRSQLGELLKGKASLRVSQLHYAGLYLCWQHALLLTSYCLLPGKEIPAVHIKLETEIKLSWYAGGGVGCDKRAEEAPGRVFNSVPWAKKSPGSKPGCGD